MNWRNKYDRRRLLIVLLLVSGFALWVSPVLRFRLISLFEYPLHYKEYKHFGIRIPGDYTVHGIDVSKWQRRVDWARVRQMKVGDIHVTFAFIKATEGTWRTDAEFVPNWENARQNGIIRGAYHFFLPNVSPKSQAVHFIRTVRLRQGDLPPVIDIEEERGMSGDQIRKYTLEMAKILEKHYGVKPILYTNRDFYKQYFSEQADFKPYIFWIAHYHVTQLTMPDDAKWHFWQHSDRGNINGINEPVDFNVFYGDSMALRRLCIP